MDDCTSSKKQGWRSLGVFISGASVFVISVCYLTQPDGLAPVVLVPPWFWLIPGIALAILSYRACKKSWFIGVLTLWTIFAASFVEEFYSLARDRNAATTERQAARDRGHAIRIISLNCYMGQARSVREVAVWRPDIVLLQESPGDKDLEQLSQMLFGAQGAFVSGGDVSILAGGRLFPKYTNPASHFVHAELVLKQAKPRAVFERRSAQRITQALETSLCHASILSDFRVGDKQRYFCRMA